MQIDEFASFPVIIGFFAAGFGGDCLRGFFGFGKSFFTGFFTEIFSIVSGPVCEEKSACSASLSRSSKRLTLTSELSSFIFRA